MPEGETLAAFAATGAVLAIHLSVHMLDKVIAELTPHYGADCPVAVVWRASWPDQRIVRATLGDAAMLAVGSEHRAHRAHPGRPHAGRAGFRREPALCRRLRSPLSAGRRRPALSGGVVMARWPRHLRAGLRRRQDHADAGAGARLARPRTCACSASRAAPIISIRRFMPPRPGALRSTSTAGRWIAGTIVASRQSRH